MPAGDDPEYSCISERRAALPRRIMTGELRKKMLEFPKGQLDTVLDTDAFNEIDDQFAIQQEVYGVVQGRPADAVILFLHENIKGFYVKMP